MMLSLMLWGPLTSTTCGNYYTQNHSNFHFFIQKLEFTASLDIHRVFEQLILTTGRLYTTLFNFLQFTLAILLVKSMVGH